MAGDTRRDYQVVRLLVECYAWLAVLSGSKELLLIIGAVGLGVQGGHRLTYAWNRAQQQWAQVTFLVI